MNTERPSAFALKRARAVLTSNLQRPSLKKKKKTTLEARDMKRVALVWLCLLSVAQISLLQSAAMADPSEAPGASSSRVDARAAIRSRKLVSEAAAEPAPTVAGPSEEKEGSPAEAEAAAEVPLGAEAAAGAAATTKHRSSDKSVAGGGVIIGGLVTAIFAAVFCYIRVTRKRDGGPR